MSSFKSMLSALESSSKSHLGEEDVLQEYLKSFIEECNTENAHKAQVDERNKKKVTHVFKMKLIYLKSL